MRFEEFRQDIRSIAFMGVFLCVYLIPLALGFAWNSLGGYNALDPPDGYSGRLPLERITVEAWGAGVVSVPDHIRTRLYLTEREWPLWNPYQGLGQPLAAMGEGGPYFPPAMLRSLAPYSWSNLFLVANVFIAQIFFFYFLRNVGLSRMASAFGGVAFALSGAVSFHLARANILDQISMIPVLFWAVSHATKHRSFRAYAVLAIATAVHTVAGFVQVAMLTEVLALIYGGFVIASSVSDSESRKREVLTLLGATLIGLGLVGFYLMPLLAWLVSGVGKNHALLAFLGLPVANIVAFFFPMVFGPWFSARPPMPAVPNAFSFADWMVHWDNLYAVAGTVVLLLAVSAVWGTRFDRRDVRGAYWFFLIAAVFLSMRFIELAPAAVVNFLPIIGRQSPKHANALMVFAFVVAAAIAVDQFRNLDLAKAKRVMTGVALYFATVFLTLAGIYASSVYEVGGALSAMQILGILGWAAPTVLIVFAAIVVFAEAGVLSDRGRAQFLLTALVAAELVLYIPFGNSGIWPYRLMPSAFLVVAALAAAGAWPRAHRFLAPSALVAAVVGFGYLVGVGPGLPRAIDLTQPPRFLAWLQNAASDKYRTFGVFPDYSVAGKVQDIGTVGPLAPPEFVDFVRLVSSDDVFTEYVKTGHFMLAGPWVYHLEDYATYRPIFDWLGVKYVVLDRSQHTTEAISGFLGQPNVTAAYADDRVQIAESATARPKAELWSEVRVAETRDDILARLRQEPSLFVGPPFVERASAGAVRALSTTSTGPGTGEVQVTKYDLNRIEMDVTTESKGGLVVVKDLFAPGWRAKVDERPADVIRVNGLVRGVSVSAAGPHRVVLAYRPAAFFGGLIVSVLAVISVIVILASAWRRRLDGSAAGVTDDRMKARMTPWFALGSVAAAVAAVAYFEAYFGVSGPLTAIGESFARSTLLW